MISTRFSIIIPCYNRRHMIADALDSVVNQAIDDVYEVIVADDGSSDGSPEFVEQTYGDHVQLHLQSNAGPGAARNLAVAHAAGEYLVFLDSDDQLLPWALQTYDELIKKCDSPAIIMGKEQAVGEGSTAATVGRKQLRCRVFKDFYHSRMAMPLLMTDRLVMRRDVFDAIGGFAEEIRVGEDVDLIARAGTAEGFVVVDSPTTFLRRVHENQLTGTADLTSAGRMFLLDREKRGELPGGEAYRHLRLVTLTYLGRMGAVETLKHGLLGDGWRFYFKTFWWNLLLGRLKFLVAYPFMQIVKALTGYPRRQPKLQV